MSKTAVVLVHGICIRDKGLHRSRQWGRIPQALRKAGHIVVFGNQDAWGTTTSNAEQIGDAIEFAASQSPDGQVIVIAHSKGGLDSLAACKLERTQGKVRTLITLSTPHRGMTFCDQLLRSKFVIPLVAAPFVDRAGRWWGDKNPNSMGALRCLSTTTAPKHATAPVRLISIGFSARQPKDPVAAVVRKTDGANDGLVPLAATEAGEWRVAHAWNAGDVFRHIDCTDDRGLDIPLELNGERYDSIIDLVCRMVEETSICEGGN